MKFCPHCGGDLSAYQAAENGSAAPATAVIVGKYDQDETWKQLQALANELRAEPPDHATIVYHAIAKSGASWPGATIVHIVFDRSIVPRGGVLHQAALLEGRASPNLGRLAAMGYAVVEDKVLVVNDVPVGPAYQVLDYWGGEKQHRRWHLEEPIAIETSRHGNPYFMDENMIAFGAKWGDGDHATEGLIELLGLFSRGIHGAGIVGIPLAMKLVPLPRSQ